MVRNWIKSHREALNLSQDELAAALQLHGIDIGRATVSHWEAGRHNPPYSDPQFVNAIARILNMSVLDVLREAGYRLALESLTDDELHVIQALRRGDKIEAIRVIVDP